MQLFERKGILIGENENILDLLSVLSVVENKGERYFLMDLNNDTITKTLKKREKNILAYRLSFRESKGEDITDLDYW